ncbi:MAG: hypothetical protein AABX54_00275 [Nanoarchaeota archaeon]
MAEKTIVLKSTGAIGDLVIASALPVALNKMGYHTGVISKGFTLPLWKGLDNVSMFADEKQVPEGSQVVDISDYLSNFPNSRILPTTYTGKLSERNGHLCEWMAYSVFLKSGVVFRASRDDVRIMLTDEELRAGGQKIDDIAKENNGKPVVVIAPYSTTKNKNIPKKALEQIVRGVSGFAVPCLLEPFSQEQYIEGTKPVGDKDLRVASAILYNADAYIGVDSGPLHMINATRQGVSFADGTKPKRDNIIAALGSSDPDVVAYADNRIIRTTGGCPISPCGAHGYWPVEKYGEEFRRVFYNSGNEKDKSGCIYGNYSQLDTAQCLESVNPEEVVEAVRNVLK